MWDPQFIYFEPQKDTYKQPKHVFSFSNDYTLNVQTKMKQKFELSYQYVIN